MVNRPSSRQQRKLIEVALPLDAINKASVREKSIRHGPHPSTHASVVGSATVGGGSGCDLFPDGGRSVGQSRPVSDRGGAGERAAAAVPQSSKSWSSGRTRPTRRCCSGRVTRSGSRGVGPAPRTPTIRARTSCSTVTSCPPSTIPSPAVARCHWRRSGSDLRRTPVRPQPGRGADQQGDDRDSAQVRGKAAGQSRHAAAKRV